MELMDTYNTLRATEKKRVEEVIVIFDVFMLQKFIVEIIRSQCVFIIKTEYLL